IGVGFGEGGVSGAKPPWPAYAAAESVSGTPNARTRRRRLLRRTLRVPVSPKKQVGRRSPAPQELRNALSPSHRVCDSKRMDERSRVELPPGVGDRYEVYVNGRRQETGQDFDRIG